MADTFQIAVVTPEKLVLDQQAEFAEIPGKDQSQFTSAGLETKYAILQKFVDAGAQAVVTKNARVASSMPGWQRIGDTQYYIWRR